MNRKALLLYLIGKAKKIEGKTRFQKLVFLLQKEKKIPFNYNYYPYQKGPLSFELIEDINSLISNGLVIESISPTAYRPRYDYSLSPIGKEYVNSVVEKDVNYLDKQKINGILNRWNNVVLNKLLDYVHKRYPELKA